MQNPENRDMMAELYKIFERYETPPEDPAQYGAYFDAARIDLTTFYHKWWEIGHNIVARELSHALYSGLCALCRPKPKTQDEQERG